jgi:hypothetical protein
MHVATATHSLMSREENLVQPVPDFPVVRGSDASTPLEYLTVPSAFIKTNAVARPPSLISPRSVAISASSAANFTSRFSRRTSSDALSSGTPPARPVDGIQTANKHTTAGAAT